MFLEIFYSWFSFEAVLKRRLYLPHSHPSKPTTLQTVLVLEFRVFSTGGLEYLLNSVGMSRAWGSCPFLFGAGSCQIPAWKTGANDIVTNKISYSYHACVHRLMELISSDHPNH